jgi:hypothetical protein
MDFLVRGFASGPHLAHEPDSAPTTRRFSACSKIAKSSRGLGLQVAEDMRVCFCSNFLSAALGIINHSETVVDHPAFP